MESNPEVAEIHFISHPGHALRREDLYETESPTAPLNLRKEDYLRYWHELGSLVEKHGQSNDVKVAVLYDEKDTDYREFIDEEYVDAAIETEGFLDITGKPLESEEEKIDELVSALEDAGRATVSGELYGLCPGQFSEYLEQEYGIKPEKGATFPRRPLERTNGTVHWEDSIPLRAAMNKF